MGAKCKMFALTLWVVLSGFIQPSALLRLNKNGGYDLSIAIDEDTPPPGYSPVLYFNKVRLVAQTLSNGMYYVTNKTFFINSVELLLPRSWNTVVPPAKTQSFEGADIRISNKFQYLRTENPNLCGLPGQFIEVPRELFDNTGYTSKYGTPWKALFTQWARYRWGIWEEHGYPGDSRFPYFYRKPEDSGWSVTGCSDVELVGEYQTIQNKTCRADGNEFPGDDCRFYPESSSNAATTSIMHFHWLDNVAQLCDESNHNSEAPNRQNRNCGHQSSWEVIKETPDFKYATDPRPDFIPTLEIVVVQRSPYPRLLILLDKGTTKVSHKLRERVQSELGRLFKRGQLPAETVAKIANFPSQNPMSNAAEVISAQIEWDLVENNVPFESALNLTRSSNQEREDFGLAIQAIINECKQMNHPEGCLMIVVKTGSSKATFHQMTYEMDTLISLREDPRLKVYAIELLNEIDESQHLKSVAEVSGGRQVAILSDKDVQSKLDPIVNEIISLFSSGGKTAQGGSFQNVYRGILQANQVQEISTPVVNVDFLEFRVTSRVKIDTASIYFEPLDVPNYEKVIVSPSSVDYEWNEATDFSRRYVYSVTVKEDILANAARWRVYFTDDADSSALLNIFATRSSPLNDLPDDGITFTLSTSLNDIDMSDNGLSISPFNVFLSAHKVGQPVTKLSVQATVESLTTGQSWQLPLLDNGLGDPDVYIGDGIYSASFLPPMDGNYHIFSYVQNSHCSATNEAKLILPEQGNIGCFPNAKDYDSANSACAGTVIRGKYTKLVATPGVVAVRNSPLAIAGKPYRILDMEALTDESTGIVTLQFIAPRVFGSDSSPTHYVIYSSRSMKSLWNERRQNLALAEVTSGTSATIEYIRIRPGSSNVTFYAVEAVYGNQRSGLSNIVSAKSMATKANGASTVIFEGNVREYVSQEMPKIKIRLYWGSKEVLIVAMLVNITTFITIISCALCIHRRRINHSAASVTTDTFEKVKV